MALIELSRAIAADPAAGRRWAAEPLPLTDRLTALLAAQFRGLPGASREALLVAAVADSADGPTAEAGGGAARPGGVAGMAGAAGAAVLPGLPGLSAGALAPAETAGLIRAAAGRGPQFTHPLVRSAVYHAVPFADRAAAHLRVAGALRDQPDRYAWHLAAAALEPDERTAALLEETAAVAQRRGGAAAAARALERAAQLSPAEPDRARRLLAAAGLARQAGQADWVRELCTGVLTLTADPGLRLAARLSIGWALVWSDQHAGALAALLSVASDAAGPWPEAAADALVLAATVAYQTGGPADRQAVLSAMDRILVPAGQAAPAVPGLPRRAPPVDPRLRLAGRAAGRDTAAAARDRRRGGARSFPGRRGRLAARRDRAGGPPAPRGDQQTACARGPQRERRGAVRPAVGLYRQRPLGRGAGRRPRGRRRGGGLQDGVGRGVGRPGHRDGADPARRPRRGAAAAGPGRGDRRRGRIPCLYGQDPARGGPVGPGAGPLRRCV